MIHFVAPRDVFNKANLTKCIGRFAQLIEQGELPGLSLTIDDEFFFSSIDSNSGELVTECIVEFDSANNLDVTNAYFSRGCNSREPWPLWLNLEDDSESIEVFNHEGELSEDILEFCKLNFPCGQSVNKSVRPSISGDLYRLAKFEKACGVFSLDIHDGKHRNRGLVIDEDRFGLLGLNTLKLDNYYCIDSLVQLECGSELQLCEGGSGALPLMINLGDEAKLPVFTNDGLGYTSEFQACDFSSMSESDINDDYQHHYSR